jgi:hypothetical protein
MARMVLLVAGVLGFAIGSFVPNRYGGILALVSALLVIFLFLFTASDSPGSIEEYGRAEESRS